MTSTTRKMSSSASCDRLCWKSTRRSGRLGSDRIIAVAEFYQRADQLSLALRNDRLRSSIVVALVTLAMLSVLFLIVRRGSRTIESQQRALHDRISQLSGLLAQNESLRKRIDELYVRSAETHESFLRRVGSELHDGPAQLIALRAAQARCLASEAWSAERGSGRLRKNQRRAGGRPRRHQEHIDRAHTSGAGGCFAGRGSPARGPQSRAPDRHARALRGR